MAKRFTDTDKFIDPWYRRLSTKNKLLWDWLLCNCDHAGIITIDFEFVEMVLNEKFEDTVLDKFFSERIVQLSPFKYFIPKFLRFQYGKLNPGSKVHASVIQKLKDEGILYNDADSIKEIENNARVIEYVKGIHTIKEKEKDKAKDKDKVKEEEECVKKILPDVLPKDFRNSKVSPDQLQQTFNEMLAGKGKIVHCRGLSGKNIQDFSTTTAYEEFSKIETWKEIFTNVSKSEFLMGVQQGSSFVATLNWLICHDNALKVLNGQYGGGSTENASNGLFDGIKDELNEGA